MRLALLLFLLPMLAWANPWTYRVNTASTNIASTFPLVPQLSGPPNYIANVQIDNQTAVELEVNCNSATKPSSDAVNSFYIAAYTTYEAPTGMPQLNYPLGSVCWIRGISTVSSGIVRVTAWGY